jgi:uncharacterized damage-inducible protein DinB
MNRIELLLHGWDHTYEEEDWYPPLLDALKGVTAAQADWRPEGSVVNTIWGNVHHLIFYKERMWKRLTGEEKEYPSGVTNDDTFAVEAKGEAAWQETQARLERVHRGVRNRLASLSDEDFDRGMPTRALDQWVNSLIQHDAYHTGEIILLRKLQGSWPARRSFE